jgi:hypothetical protein
MLAYGRRCITSDVLPVAFDIIALCTLGLAYVLVLALGIANA